MPSKGVTRTALFLLGVLALVALNLSGCGTSGGVAQPEPGSAAASAQKRFEAWAQWQSITYQNVRYETMTDNGSFATIRITAEFQSTEFQPSVAPPWTKQEAQVECRKNGDDWQCDQDMTFRYTAAQAAQVAATYQANATMEAAKESAIEQATAAVVQATAAAVQATATAKDRTAIAFVSDRDGKNNREIYVMDVDGSNLIRLTNNPATDEAPAWSPDSSQIAFVSDRDGNEEIYVMNADGSNQTRLTNNPARDSNPAWSPNGQRIAFDSNRDISNEIYVMNADGSSQTRLTKNPDYDPSQPTGSWHPIWFPDGQQIAFISTLDGTARMYVMNANGSSQSKWSHCVTRDLALSPDGQRFALAYDVLAVTDAACRNGVRLTFFEDYPYYNPTWSPSGQVIAVCYSNEIYIIGADGSNPINLTDSPAYDAQPAWSPRRP